MLKVKTIRPTRLMILWLQLHKFQISQDCREPPCPQSFWENILCMYETKLEIFANKFLKFYIPKPKNETCKENNFSVYPPIIRNNCPPFLSNSPGESSVSCGWCAEIVAADVPLSMLCYHYPCPCPAKASSVGETLSFVLKVKCESTITFWICI